MPLGQKQERHGLRYLPEYEIWLTMKQRCHNPRSQRYKYYGARGIKVCEAWRASFATFLADVGRRPSPELTLDREDNNKGYEPGNVRWVPQAVQKQNRRNVTRYEHEGKTLLLSEWATEKNLPLELLEARVKTGGWTIERALTTPVGDPPKHSKMQTLNGKTQTIAAWARERGIKYVTLKARIRRGVPLDKALIP